MNQSLPPLSPANLFMRLPWPWVPLQPTLLLSFTAISFFSKTARWVEAIGASSALQMTGQERQVAIRNVGQLSRFFKGPTAAAALNIVWVPLFLTALVLIHPLFLLLATGVIATIILIKFVTEFLTQDQAQSSAALSRQEQQTLKDATDFQKVSGIRAMAENLKAKFFSIQSQRHLSEDQITAASSMRTASLGFIRMSSQILALALGASLVVSGDLSSGGMIGASIITAKTITTIEASINSLTDIKMSYAAFQQMRLDLARNHVAPTEVPHLSGALRVEGLIFPRGGGAPPRLDRVSFSLEAGECLAIVGDSGSGKTTLLHALCGIDPCPIGSTFLDESEIRTLGPVTFNQAVGYLPQQAQLLNGTLAQNISCFAPEPDDQQIVNAAKIVSVKGTPSLR